MFLFDFIGLVVGVGCWGRVGVGVGVEVGVGVGVRVGLIKKVGVGGIGFFFVDHLKNFLKNH